MPKILSYHYEAYLKALNRDFPFNLINLEIEKIFENILGKFELLEKSIEEIDIMWHKEEFLSQEQVKILSLYQKQ